MHQPDEPDLVLNINRPSVVSQKEQQAWKSQCRADDKEHHPPYGIGEISCRRPRHVAAHGHKTAEQGILCRSKLPVTQAHEECRLPNTVEGGALRKERAHICFSVGTMNIHSSSAAWQSL